jgi:AcrR family transcriptional regulator
VAAEPHSAAAEAIDSATATRERLLDSAEALFAGRGFHAASVRDITHAASSNLAAVNYHFGSKANLYRAVFLRRLGALRDLRVRAVERAIERDGGDLEAILRAFARSFLEPLVSGEAGKRWVRLSSRELLDPQLPPGLFFDEIIQPTQASLARALKRLCPGLDSEQARFCAQSLVGQLMHIRLLHSYLTAAGDAKSTRGYELPKMTEHAVAFSAAAIRSLERRA